MPTRRTQRNALQACSCGYAPLFRSDEAIAALVLGTEAHLWPRVVRQLEREGLPRSQQMLGGLRYVPAVIAFFDRRAGLSEHDTFAEDGPERFGP